MRHRQPKEATFATFLNSEQYLTGMTIYFLAHALSNFVSDRDMRRIFFATGFKFCIHFSHTLWHPYYSCIRRGGLQ